jgi:hypothetical protein
MRVSSSVLRGVLGCLIVAGGVAAFAEPPADDPWTGRTRAEIESLLGEPTKAKQSKDGSGVMTYKFVRVGPGFVPGPDILLIEVPGIGPAARSARPDDGRPRDDIAFEPTDSDSHGELIGGGVRTSRSRSVSKDLKTGVVDDDSPPPGPAGRERFKLRFELDADGRVVSWSVSPKKIAR